jgi:plastocyanin
VISIKDFKFSPTPLNAKVGDTITVTNEDDTDHELKADDGSFDAGRYAKGSGTITVTKAGTFAYHCDVHDYMTGVIQVAGS